MLVSGFPYLLKETFSTLVGAVYRANQYLKDSRYQKKKGLVVELILSLPVHTKSLLSVLFASGETDEELICGSVVSFSLTCLDFLSKKLVIGRSFFYYPHFLILKLVLTLHALQFFCIPAFRVIFSRLSIIKLLYKITLLSHHELFLHLAIL